MLPEKLIKTTIIPIDIKLTIILDLAEFILLFYLKLLKLIKIINKLFNKSNE